jgi:molybdopterin-containing oxidoreductase family membrane subunit
LYLWVLLERRFGRFSGLVGTAAFAWRVTLTSGTGLILGFLVARQAFGSAVVAPLFIALSLAWGLAAFCLAQAALELGRGGAIDDGFSRRMGRLLGLFVIVVLWLTAIYHGANLYWARQDAFERFILLDGAPYAALFWGGFILLGSLVPLALVYHPRLSGPRSTLIASALVIAGGFAFVYVFIIGAQVFPLEIFPGYEASSAFSDGIVDPYAPSLAEALLGIGGVAMAAAITAIGARVLPILPARQP